jgi:hypothetical protein
MATAEPIDVTDQLNLPAMPERQALVSTGINPETLLSQAISANVPIETLERLLALREKLHAEQARAAYFAALAAFQGECPIIGKNKTAKIEGSRGSYSYSYAPLDEIVRQVGPILQRHGLSYTFDTRDEERAKVVICTVHHVAGHSESTTFRVPVDQGARMNDAQKDASAVTYGRRYAFCGSLGILTGDADDDGHLGGTKDGEKPTGGPTDFAPPQRASASKPPARDLTVSEDGHRAPKADDDKGPPPDDAISEGKVRRVYALIHTALERHGKRNDVHALAAVEDAIDAVVLSQMGRRSWKFIPWKGRAYVDLCAALDGVVDDLSERGELLPPAPAPKARYVLRPVRK